MSELGFIHRYMPSRGGSSKTLLLLHGTGGNENDLLPLGAELAPDAGILSPRGKVLENGMPRFFRRLAEGVFDQEDLLYRSNELAEFIVAAANHYGFDPAGLVAVGYSNGANIAASILLRSPHTIPAAALLHAMVPFVPDQSPDLSGKRIFITAGENDPIVSATETMRLEEMLRGYGADVHSAWFRHGHSLSSVEVQAVGTWLESHG